ncbi:three component ABC system middle component [uncultured Dokdonia sp.]|uniref:three component ABC system middle component n=1 Tax=uncultured Dokdonia sp. TaxID=575653 RepID=UPI00260286E6|nr:three component ABC system middle component [uncultured Dokdonia sp.]
MERVNRRKIELSEYDIVQNYIIGSHILREFVKFYQRYSQENIGPELILTMPILPLVLNKSSSFEISKRHYIEGGLMKTIYDDKTLYVGLQNRMEKMYDLSLKSLSMCFSSGLLNYDKNTSRLTIIDEANPNLQYAENYKQILRASRRLGAWFAKLSIEELTTIFKIKF